MLASALRGSLWDRMIGAALLDENVYEYVQHDRSATAQAAVVVAMGALAAGIGALADGALGFLVGVVSALLGWAAYAYVAHWVGTRWFKAEQTPTTRGELLRTLGFACSPLLLLVLGALPLLGGLLTLMVFVWTLGTTVMAVRQALALDLWRSLATAQVSWLVLFSVWLLAAAVV